MTQRYPVINQTDPVARLNQAVRSINGRFTFERPTEVVGRCTVSAAPGGLPHDADIHDGTIVTAHGYARLALHKPTGTVCLFTSKASINLQGTRQSDGSIIADYDGIRQSYIVAAYRTDGSSADLLRVAPHARRALRRFNEDLGERSEKHFTLYGAKAVSSRGTDTEFHTNGRLAYLLENLGKGKGYRVRFYAPTKRKDGSFVPVQLERNSLSSKFASVSRVISTAGNYEQARHDMALHWQRISSKLWDERSIYEGEGLYFNTKKSIARLFNTLAERGPQLTLVTAIIGIGMGLISAKYGIIGGLIAAVLHTAAHHVLDESYALSNEQLKKLREARRRLNIEAYPMGENVADHFKLQTRDNISRLCAKTDMARFKGEEFVWLTAARSGILLDHEKAVDGFHPSSLRAHLLFVHQRGFSSSCTLPDPRTRLDVFQSGLIRLMHERADGRVAIYSRYDESACVAPALRLPQDKIDKMGGGIVHIEYDRTRDSFYHAFERGPETVSFEEMMQDIEDNMLFRGMSGVTPQIRAAALHAIRATFQRDAEPVKGREHLYLGGRPPSPPPLRALDT